tara:strand:+ start:557 stop:778 length:222 start_codon:yes stop_codon:yes gene_type:complete
MSQSVNYNIQKAKFKDQEFMYFSNSGFIQKDAVSLVKFHKTNGNFTILLNINYVPVANRQNQIMSIMEFGAFT